MDRQHITAQSELECILINESAEPKALPLSLLKHITNDFSDGREIGTGGYSKVYKGMLDNGIFIAVKMHLNPVDIDDKKFTEEVTCLLEAKHKSIVRFLGYCAESQGEMLPFKGKLKLTEVRQRLFCFEYLPNLSLDKYIKDASRELEWSKCYKIITGICDGLYYLHQNSILHLDLKPANILLDDNMIPKIADFGLSRIFDVGQSWVIASKVSGTWGYMAPELIRENIITFKSDIYSLGIIMIEMLTGERGNPDIVNVLERWTSRLDNTQGGTQLEQVRVCTEIGIQCTDFDPLKRPDTQHIVDRLGATKSVDEFSTETETAEVHNGDSPAPEVPSGASTSSSADNRYYLHRSSRMPGVIEDAEIMAQTTGTLNLERAKTERRRQSNPADDAAKQLLDAKISVRRKLKMLNRIAIVREDIPYRPPMKIVILVVGTLGDVQPFVAIGKLLQDYGHRVRLATHAYYKEFVLTAGLEFFPLGGDPKALAEYMVKNKGFMPSGASEIPIQRKQMKEIIFSLLPACEDPDPETGTPFKVDAIIANPPVYGHTDVAEALKVPLHIFFTMPWTPTSELRHPLSHVKNGYRLSYQLVDSTIWLGMRDIINEFRTKKLKLRRVTYLRDGSGIPHGYIWSPHLVPKPKDWGPTIDVVGFCFPDLASMYVPPEALVKWLEAGDKPIYVGFGSIPVQDPAKMTDTIVQALELTGQRGIINKGWGGLGTLAETKDSIYVLDNCPHDWLFLQCKAVVHHGGAGTTAAGLKATCPTTIVSFFGDQPFWGDRVHGRGAGPPPIPVDQFNLQNLVDAIKFMLEPKVKIKTMELAKAMESEDGVGGAVRAFLKNLPSKSDEESPPPRPGIRDFLGLMRKAFGA